MIKNKLNFVPAGMDPQPEFYREYFGCVTAVFRHPNGRNILLRIDAKYSCDKTEGHFYDTSGNLVFEYQGKNCRHTLAPQYQTLKDAFFFLKKLIQKPDYGEDYKDKPEPVDEMDGIRYFNRILVEKEEKRLKAICKYFVPETPFTLTDDDKKTLLESGYEKSDFAQIELCANKSIYILDKKEAITMEKAIEILGRETFLSGISRSAFHWDSARETPDGEHSVFFESRPFSPFRKKQKK